MLTEVLCEKRKELWVGIGDVMNGLSFSIRQNEMQIMMVFRKSYLRYPLQTALQKKSIAFSLTFHIIFVLLVGFGPPRIIGECELKKPRKFLYLKFDNKGISTTSSTIKIYSPVFCLT